MSDEEIPQHQPWSPPRSDEEVDEEQPRTLKRERPFFGQKKPFVFGGRMEFSDEEDDEPDLGAYFAQWHLSDKQIIICCRSYASYLSAKKDAKKK